MVEYYARYLANQQNDLAKVAGLNDSLRIAMSIRIYRDFGLDVRGNAARNSTGDVAWPAGSIGAKNSANKHGVAGYSAASHFASRDNVLNAVISKSYNNSPTVEAIKTWQAAYPAIKDAKCQSSPLPPIRVSTIRTTTMTCAETGVSDAVQQAGLAACEKISATLKSNINLVCAKPKGEQVTDAQVEMMRWHKEKRFAAAGLTCSYDLLWNTKAVGCSDPIYTTQCNALLAKEFKGKMDIPKAGVMDCQVKRTPEQKKWVDAMPQVAQVLSPGFDLKIDVNTPPKADAAKLKPCKVSADDALVASCPKPVVAVGSPTYKLAEQLLGAGRVRTCTDAERAGGHWVATPCIDWYQPAVSVADARDQITQQVGSSSGVAVTGGGTAKIGGSSVAVDAAATQGCKPYLGRADELFCADVTGFYGCKVQVDSGKLKSCRQAGSQQVYSKPLAVTAGGALTG